MTGTMVKMTGRVRGTNLRTERPKFAKGNGVVSNVRHSVVGDQHFTVVLIRWDNDVISGHWTGDASQFDAIELA